MRSTKENRRLCMKKFVKQITLSSFLISALLPVNLAVAENKTTTNLDPPSINQQTSVSEFPKQRQKQKTELLGKRTENQKEFLNPDGTITQELYLNPVHWKSKNGKWKEINNNLVDEKNGSENYFKNKSNSYEIRFNKNTKKKALFKLKEDGHTIEMSIDDANRSKLRKQNNELTYNGILPNLNMDYIVTANGVKENIILNNEQAPSEINYAIKTDLDLKQENGSVLFIDKEKKEIFRTEPFFAYDQKDALTRNIDLLINKKEEGIWNLKVKLDKKWLTDKSRSFPVVIDPSITYQHTKDTVQDTFAYEGQPTTSYQDLSYIRAGNNGYGKSRSYLQFALPELYPSSELISARMELSHFGNNPGSSLQIQQVKSSWKPEQVTWNNQPTVETSAISESSGIQEPQSFYMTQLVKDWYAGKTPNYGVMVRAKNESDTKQEFLASENLDPLKTPKIVLTYKINPIGGESSWTYDNDTNLVNGNLYFEETDTSLDGRGIPINVGRVYNSLLKDQVSELGRGWMSNLSDKLYYQDPENSKVVRYRESDGTNYYFTKISGVWKASNLDMDLTYDSSKQTFSMIDNEQTVCEYDNNGDLISIQDSNNNKTVFTRENGLVTKITDASNRFVNLIYNDGLLSEINGNEINTVKYYYDSQKQLVDVQTMGQNGSILNKVHYGYDENNRINIVQDNADNKTDIHYDSSGRVMENIQHTIQNNINKELKLSYEYGTNFVIKTNPKGIKTKYHFNDLGNTTMIEDDYNPVTNTSYSQTKWIWDQNNMVSKVTDPRGNSVLYTYDEKNNVTSTEDSKGYSQIMKYDNKNNLTQATGFGGETFKKYYDKNKNVTDDVDPSSTSSLYDYDSFGNLLSETKAISISNNLVQNSGFEKWNGYPDYWVPTSGQNGTISRSDVKKNGNYSVKISSINSGQLASITSEYIPIGSEKTYSFAYQAKLSSLSSNGKLTGSIKWYAQDYSTLIGETKLDDVMESSDWTKRSKEFNSPENASFARIVFNSKEMDAYIDNVQMEEGSFINAYTYLLNGDFETDKDQNGNPDNFGTIASIEPNDGVDKTVFKNGKQSLLINGNDNDKYYIQPVNYAGKKGSSLILSGFAKTQNVSSTGGPIEAELEIEYNDGTKEYHSLAFPKETSDWRYQEKEIKAKDDYKRFTIRTRVKNQQGKVWFDDIAVRLNSIKQATISDYNLSPNSSFEYLDSNGKVANWSISSGATAPYYDVYQGEDAFVGERSFRIQPKGSYAALTTDYLEARKANTDYSATIVAKTEDVTNLGAYLKIRAYDANNNVIGDKTSKIINHNGDWKRYFVSLKRDEFPSAVKLKAMVEFPSGANGSYMFDAVRFQENNLLSTYEYDSKGNYMIKEVDEEGTPIVYDIDNKGQIKSIQYPNPNTSSHFEYDELGRINKSYDSSNLRTEMEYDNAGNVKTINYYNHLNNTLLSSYKNEYTSFGELLKSTNPLNQVTTYQYDELGQVTNLKNPNGKEINYEYDNVGNLKRLSYVGDPTIWDYEYDKSGNITKVSKNGDVVRTYSFDSQLDQLNGITYPSISGKQHSMTFGYNSRGEITSYRFSPQQKSVLFGFDNAGEAIEMTGVNGQSSKVIFDESDRLQKVESSLGNNTFKTYYEYDNVGQATKMIIEGADGKSIEREETIYDKQGNITETRYLDGSKQTYVYDSANRLTEENYYSTSGQKTKTISYEYDVMGNRTKKIEDGVTTTYTYDKANRVQNINGTSYEYDANGNLIKDANKIHSYNGNDELTTLKSTNGDTIASYEYDENGKRTKKVTPEKTEYYYYLGNDLTYINDENNNIKYEFTRDAQGNLFTFTDYTASTPKLYYYQLNSSGDVVGLRDEQGNSVVTYKYDSFGRITQSTGNVVLGNGKLLKEENPFRYSSYVYDEENKYYYLKNRYYDADTGRFITEDPIESENLYTYADNNPLKFYDDDGNKSKKKNKKKRQKAKKIIKQGVVLVGDFIGVNDAVNCVKSPGWKSCGKAVINITPVGKVNKAYKAGKAGVKLLKTARKKIEDTCHCFTAGTKVLTDKGEKKIEDVKYGDKVLSKDDDTGDVAYKSVVGLFQKYVGVTYNIYVGKEIITTTGEHPFWVKESHKWVKAKDLQKGDLLTTNNSKVIRINKIIIKNKTHKVYNFMVEGYHNYYVSNLGIWTHNKKNCNIDLDIVSRKIIAQVPNHQMIKPPRRGLAPISKIDNKQIEIHHLDQNPTGPFLEMHFTYHRGKGYDKINHPNKGQPSRINRNEWNRQKTDYWEKQWDSGRWD